MNFDATKQCPAGCGRELKCNIVEEQYEFCSCLEDAQKKVPPAKDQESIATVFEKELYDLIARYKDTHVTIGAIVGALQNRIFMLLAGTQREALKQLLKELDNDP